MLGNDFGYPQYGAINANQFMPGLQQPIY